MAFLALDLSLQITRLLREPVAAIRQSDRDLANQLQRAASSVALNLGEGSGRRGRDRLQHYRVAQGSAIEARTALQLASSWGYLDLDSVQEPLDLIDRELAILWSLTH